MHQGLKLDVVLPIGAAALLGLVCVVVPTLDIGLVARATLAGAFVAATAGGCILLGIRRERMELSARKALERLLSTDNCDSQFKSSSDNSVSLLSDNPWREIVARIEQTLHDDRQRLQTAEHGRTRAEVRLRRVSVEREQLAEVLAGLPDPVLAIDHFDELVLANPSAERLFSFDSQSTEERAVESLVRCENLVALLTDTRRRKATTQRSSELAVANAAGETRWFRVTCSGLAHVGDSADGSVTHGAVAMLSDISGQKVIQQRNAEFVSAVSHEMKAPLSGIKAYVELLADGDAEDDATREEFLGVINSQADRLQRLIDNLLNLARIEAGVANVVKEPQSLNELLEEALHVVQPSAEQKHIEFCRDLSPLYLGLSADRDMILQAAINLLSNAIKYTPEKGRVTLRSRLADGEICFEVEDTGVGLSSDDAGRVFEKFYRVAKDRQMAPGTGLGLPLAKHIIEEIHGGRLTVVSELGRGSTFRAALPAPVGLTT